MSIEKIKKLLRQAESERKIGNEGAADLFLEKASSLKQIHNITLSNEQLLVDSTEVKFINELGKSPVANPFLRANAKSVLRTLQFETLSEIVAEGYSCKVSINTTSGEAIFYGYDLDREIAIFMFLSLMDIAESNCKSEMRLHKDNVGKPPTKKLFGGGPPTYYPTEWMGDDVFTDSFHLGFREAIKDSYQKHERDYKKQSEVHSYFLSQNPDSGHYRDYYAPKLGIVNPEIIELGKKIGNSVAKKARNAPTALTTSRNLGTASSKIVDRDTVYLCLDDSGSMYGDKIQQAKDGARSFLRKAAENGMAVGLIKFGEGAKHILRPQIEIDERFEKAIERLKARDGQTDMADAIQVAQSHLINRRKKRTICIVTDGVPSNRANTLRIAKDAKRDGIEISVIGTDDADQDFINELCSRNGLGILVDRSRLALSMGEMAGKL